MNGSQLVSIIVPVYNTAAYVGRCLDSLLAQSYANIEIICVDDGSTDDSLKVLQQYAQRDTRVKVFHQENAGVSAARNKGLAEAKGEFLSFIDSDDWLDVQAYEKVIARFADDVDMVSFGFMFAYDDNSLVKYIDNNEVDYTGELSAGRLLLEIYCVWNKVVRRSLFDKYKIRFPEDMILAEDGAVGLQLLSQTKIISHIAQPLYYYFQRQTSALRQARRNKMRSLDNLKMVERVWDFAQQYGVSPALRIAIPYIYWSYYSADARLIVPEMKHLLYQEGARIGEKVQAHRAEKCGGMFYFLSEKQSKLAKCFHWYRCLRECYGLLGKSIWSVSYEPPYRIHRFMGRYVFRTRYRSIPL